MDSIPNDFGLDVVRTYSHVGDPVPSPDHSAFWNAWFERLQHEAPTLKVRDLTDDSDPTASHEFVSTRGIRIGCRLMPPPEGTSVKASIITVHGYTVPEKLKDEERHWSAVRANGVAVLAIRLRGYPGSQTNAHGQPIELNGSDRSWITQGFDACEHNGWVLPDALADVCNAVRVMRNALLGRDAKDLEPWMEGEPRRPDVYLHGRSLGGGLATIAAAQLSGRMIGRPIVDRLAIEAPSLGAWRWRLANSNTNLDGRFSEIIKAHHNRHQELTNRLRLMDAAIHSPKVQIPTLAMLASRDEVVPAPAAAAVFNAIRSDPGCKWRFCIPFGHRQRDPLNTRRVALFGKSLADFLDPQQSPTDSMAKWEDRMGLGK